MNTKEAIEFVKKEIDYITYPAFECHKEKREVIEVLERGEKYEAMWEEFKFKRGDTFAILDVPDKGTIRDDMNEFEKKYFLLPIKKTITIEIEGENEDISKFAGRLNTFVGKTNFGVRTNIKEVD